MNKDIYNILLKWSSWEKGRKGERRRENGEGRKGEREKGERRTEAVFIKLFKSLAPNRTNMVLVCSLTGKHGTPHVISIHRGARTLSCFLRIHIFYIPQNS